MAAQNKHKAWLTFQRKILDVAADYTIDNLRLFRSMSREENPSLSRIIEDYLLLARRAETDVDNNGPKSLPPLQRGRIAQMHLFDLLREKKFFPRNSDLAGFAARVVPEMRTYSFDKMARSDIAARIVEHVENSDPRARRALEQSMRDALANIGQKSPGRVDRESFLSRWERIIKGLEL